MNNFKEAYLLGYELAKTPLTKIPNIPRDYISHFIRGYFEVNGRLYWSQKKHNYKVVFISATKEFLQDIAKELEVSYLSIGYSKDTNTYSLQIFGGKRVKRILDYIYQDSTPDSRFNARYNSYLKLGASSLNL